MISTRRGAVFSWRKPAGGRHARYAKRLGQLTGMASLDVAQHEAMFRDAGFTGLRVIENAPRGWIGAVGTKPI